MNSVSARFNKSVMYELAVTRDLSPFKGVNGEVYK